MIKQENVQDQIAKAFLRECGLLTYGMEMGNWCGFAGIPMLTGIASLVEITSHNFSTDRLAFEAKVLMPHLHANVCYETMVKEAALETKLIITSNTDGLIGDAVIHLVLWPEEATLSRFNGCRLDYPGRYVYSPTDICIVEAGANRRLRISSRLTCNTQVMDIRLTPYASSLVNGSVRYHTRALCFGGANSYLVMRTKGSIGYVVMGRCGSFRSDWLYRVERKSPKYFPNTQFCAVARFPKGEQLSLCHRIERL